MKDFTRIVEVIKNIKSAEVALLIGGIVGVWVSIYVGNEEALTKSIWILMLGVFFRLANSFDKFQNHSDRVVNIHKLIAFIGFVIYFILSG
jgi:hypothetical protein